MLASAAAHGAVVLGLCLYVPALPKLPPTPSPAVRVALVAPPKALDPLPQPPLRKRIERAHAPRPAEPRPQPMPAPKLKAPRLEAEAAPELNLPSEPLELAAPTPPREPQPKAVRAAGFEGVPLSISGPSREARLQVGAFEGMSGAPGGAHEVQIRQGSFAGSQVSRAAGKPAPAVGAGGFGSAGVASSRTAGPAVASAGFGRVTGEKAEARPVEREADKKITPVEVLSKPKPVYTAEARERRIEGEVVIEARFTAAGKVEVLRIVRGLGHGLDEAAVEAVRAMRFRPAASAGGPIDSVLRVSVAFRLAY